MPYGIYDHYKIRGRPKTKAHNRKNSLAHLGKKMPKGFQDGEKNHAYGTVLSFKTIEKIRQSLSGSKNHNWKGGISKRVYPNYFSRPLKFRIRQRDGFRCQKCGKTEAKELTELGRVLCVNHINFDKNDCRPKNLNTLCVRCNASINFQREKWTRIFAQ